MLTWVGKRPLSKATAYPAQQMESFQASLPDNISPLPPGEGNSWADWPEQYPKGGLLFHGDNKDVLAHLLANGFRGKVKLIYIDPPFDSGADYVRKVQLRGVGGSTKVEGEDYTLGEQIQYTDIWANDNYLQFMYERLMLLKELLAEDGSIYLHCDCGKNHLLRLILDEVFGAENFRSEIIWKRTSAHSDSSTYGQVHDTIYFYSKSKEIIWNQPKTKYEEWYVERYYRYKDKDDRYFKSGDLSAYGLSGGGYNYSWKGKQGLWRCPETTMKSLDERNKLYYTENGIPRLKQYLDEMDGLPLQTLWDDIQPIVSWSVEKNHYPTQKSESLLCRVINSSTNTGDIILDTFIGSGTTASAAQKMGRRWIGCDINKGAIQTTAKRLQAVMSEQAAALHNDKQGKLVADENAAATPAQLTFNTYRVNDYDLQIQHNEAVALACEHIGVTRNRADGYFDGTLGKQLVKIVPFNHPLTPLDLEDLKQELKRRPDEERDVTLVCLGLELTARAWVENYNRNRPINKLAVIELRTDKKYGGFMQHEALTASVCLQRQDETLVVEITDVFSPSILQRLNMEQGIFRAHIEDWRAVVDTVMIDTNYNGEVFNIALSDVPARKQDLVEGRYELPAPPAGAVVAVKIIDMLGEEALIINTL